MNRFTMEKLDCRVRELRRWIHPQAVEIESFAYQPREDDPRFARPDFDDGSWDRFTVGNAWGGYDQVAWFRTRLAIPADWRGGELDLILEVGAKEDADTTAETLLYLDGVEAHGLDNWHSAVRLTRGQSESEGLALALRAWSGLYGGTRRFRRARLARVDAGCEKFYYCSWNVLETVRQLHEDDLRRTRLLELLDGAFRRVEYLRPGSEEFYASVSEALRFLRESLGGLAPDGEKPVIAVCGHTHIDMAWLWRLDHAVDKAARSFSTVLSLMERYPDYRFSQGSPYLYEQIEKSYPALFERIRQRVREGRWEVTGTMWVEPDTNLPDGESLVRQILLGKRYIREKFGVDCKVLWLPDVFGYSWALPQLLKKSGIELFWTNKLSWNQYNRFPYDTFRWRGLDGSEVLSQLGTCPERNVTWGSTYNGVIAPWELQGTWKQYAQKELCDEVLMPFGWGDGGGGPTREMLEGYEALRDMPGLPRAEMKGIEEFAQTLARKLEGKRTPVWDGELYFEYHRGTYTSQAWIKRANRYCERLYHDVEVLSALNDLLLGERRYPSEKLRENWKRLCVNQFHDIIPGSSIHAVYEDARMDYDRLINEGEDLLNAAARTLCGQIRAPSRQMVLFNTQSWERGGVVELDTEATGGVPAGAACQWIERDGAERIAADLAPEQAVPPMGWRALELAPPPAKPDPVRADAPLAPEYLTDDYRLSFNELGQLTRLYDRKAGREVLRPGGLGNVLEWMEDKPHQFDAWNVEVYAQDKIRTVDHLESACVLEDGPVQLSFEFRYRLDRSTIRQIVTVYRHHPGILFDTECDWQEQNILLKAAFDVGIRSTKATYDIPFGNVERPTHSNTSWEFAQFEVCAQKWADLSEDDYGVALLNDCKYGYDIKDATMRLTLLRCPTDPDGGADQGEHRFRYLLLPHQGGWRAAGVHRAACGLNAPLLAASVGPNGSGRLPGCYSFATLDVPGVLIDALKQSEDQKSWILHLHEYMQRQSALSLSLGLDGFECAETDLLEDEEGQVLSVGEGREIRLPMRPYEIKFLKLSPKTLKN